MESRIPDASSMTGKCKERFQIRAPNLHGSVMGTSGNKVLIRACPNSVNWLGMCSHSAYGGLDVDKMVLLLNQWPNLDRLILTRGHNNFPINHDTQAANILRVPIIVGNESASSQCVDLMHFYDLVLPCSQNEWMEVLNTQNGVFMAG